ncbi:hypothetical protein SOPP22_07740 [Shewanella sp. OPT22]|nr:hypothetical protein SOPP22_07740 [Shewanella sp. OPT22]
MALKCTSHNIELKDYRSIQNKTDKPSLEDSSALTITSDQPETQTKFHTTSPQQEAVDFLASESDGNSHEIELESFTCSLLKEPLPQLHCFIKSTLTEQPQEVERQEQRQQRQQSKTLCSSTSELEESKMKSDEKASVVSQPHQQIHIKRPSSKAPDAIVTKNSGIDWLNYVAADPLLKESKPTSIDPESIAALSIKERCILLKHSFDNKNEELLCTVLATFSSKEIYELLVSDISDDLLTTVINFDMKNYSFVADNIAELPTSQRLELLVSSMKSGQDNLFSCLLKAFSIHELISKKVDDKYSFLHFALINRNSNMLCALHEAGFQSDILVNEVTFDDIAFVISNHFDFLLDKLLTSKIDINSAPAPTKETLLHIAFRTNNLAAVPTLIKANAYSFMCDQDSITPLHLAVESGSSELVKLMLRRPCSFHNWKNRKGETPLQLALKSKLYDTANVLIEASIASTSEKYKIDIRALIFNGETTLLHLAIKEKAYALVHTLVKNGANNYAVDTKYGTSPLHLAVESGEPSLVTMVCSKYTSVNRFLIHGLTPLQLAVKNHSHEVVEALLRGNAVDLDKPLEGSSSNLLAYAAKNGDRNIVRLLVNAGASLRSKNEGGKNALHIAIENNQLDVLSELVSLGAYVNLVCDDKSHSPLRYAIKLGNKAAVLTMLASPGFKISNPTPTLQNSLLSVAVKHNQDTQIAELLIRTGTDINEQFGEKKQTAFMIAVKHKRRQMVDFLLAHKADQALLDTSGLPAIHQVIEQKDAECLSSLLRSKVDLEVKDNLNQTALAYSLLIFNAQAVELICSEEDRRKLERNKP